MTTAARSVLADCEIALEMLESEEDMPRWRVKWAGAVALLRAVGHVLRNVDRKEPALCSRIDNQYERWKSNREVNAIFWNFIEKERNNILKQYRFNLHPLEEVEVAVMMTVRDVETGDTKEVAEVFPLGDNIYRPIIDGFREGDDARDVYREALDWWDTQLAYLEESE